MLVLREYYNSGAICTYDESIVDRSVHGSSGLLLLIFSVTKDYSYISYDDFWSLGLRGVSVFDCCLFGAHNPWRPILTNRRSFLSTVMFSCDSRVADQARRPAARSLNGNTFPLEIIEVSNS